MSNDKIVFRTYVIGDKGGLYSPYALTHSKRHELGETYTTDDIVNERDSNRVALIKLNDKDNMLKSNRHTGFSVVGKRDPLYSLFTRYDLLGHIHDLFSTKNEAREAAASYMNNNKIWNAAPAWYKASFDIDPVAWLQTHTFANTKTMPSIREHAKDILYMNIPEEYYDYNGDSAWDNFVKNLNIMSEEADNVAPVVAAVPEDKIISLQDIIDRRLSPQRDFAEELLVQQITPKKILDNWNELHQYYKDLRSKGACGQAAFYETYGIEPTDIVSDEDKKVIIDDLCNIMDGNRKQCMITNSIKELGQ